MRPPLLLWVDEHHPLAAATLRPPASAAAIEAERLPASLAALYAAHDGQEDGPMATTFFDEGMHWLPLADAARERATFIEVLEGVKENFPEQEPFSPDWFPFARDSLGNVMVVDVVSDEVFYFDHAEGRSEGDAPKSEAFLADLLGALESGARVVDAKLGTVDPTPPPPSARVAPPGPKANPAVLVGMALVVVALLVLVFIWEAFGR